MIHLVFFLQKVYNFALYFRIYTKHSCSQNCGKVVLHITDAALFEASGGTCNNSLPRLLLLGKQTVNFRDHNSHHNSQGEMTVLTHSTNLF